jgi:hypothetical protein
MRLHPEQAGIASRVEGRLTGVATTAEKRLC